MKITKEEVAHVADLARLNLREDEKEKFTSQLNDILLYMEILNKVDTKGVEPMTHAITLHNVFREDVIRESIGRDLALGNAPDEMGDCFRVPKIIE